MSIEMRIKALKELTKNKETLAQAHIIFSLLAANIEENPKADTYHVLIWSGQAFPQDITFLSGHDVKAVLEALRLIECLDGEGFTLKRKKWFGWELVKEIIPECGLIHAHGFDRDRKCWTNENKRLQELRIAFPDIVKRETTR